MEYRIYLLGVKGWEHHCTTGLDVAMHILENIVVENSQQQIIVVRHDVEKNMDDTFYVHTGKIADFLDWKECVYKCINNIEKNEKNIVKKV